MDIAFVHSGQCWYLPYSLNQARLANPSGKIVFLGDSATGFEHTWHDVGRSESNRAREFGNVYVHMSTNSEKFEKQCFLRWFHLLEYMESSHTEEIIYLDSDVLLFVSPETILTAFCKSRGGSGYGFHVPKQQYGDFRWSAAAHASYWTIAALRDFCDFVVESFAAGRGIDRYREKFARNREQGKAGGICDMTALYLFSYLRVGEFHNLAREADGVCLDLNVNSAENYAAEEYARGANGLKRVVRRHGAFHFVRSSDEKAIRAGLIHFQGAAKRYMPKYYTGTNFNQKWRVDIEKGFLRPLLANSALRSGAKRILASLR